MRVDVGGNCKRHWVIETPNGPRSPGVCLHCGALRIFRNSTPDRRSEPKRSSASQAEPNPSEDNHDVR